MPAPASSMLADLRGASRLALDAVHAMTDLVEAVHASVPGLPAVVLPKGKHRAGIASLPYAGVRGVTRLVGTALDLALAASGPLVAAGARLPQRDGLVAALNGVLGDHLAATGNPLATRMQLRRDGQALVLGRRPLARAYPDASRRLLVLAHGLCMNDLQWDADGHDHGAALARDLGYSPVYLHYNSGLRISANGRMLSARLQRLVDAWPVPVEDLVIVGHSMGGLVARSACITAAGDGAPWQERLSRLVFLGTPHHGAPLERAGNLLQLLVDSNRFSAPFGRLGRIRSAGIRDLRHGNVRDADWQAGEWHRDMRAPAPLPVAVRAYAIAGSLDAAAERTATWPRGDGLVPVASAFGEHPDPRFALRLPASRRALLHACSHLGLLGSRDAYAHLRRWLA